MVLIIPLIVLSIIVYGMVSGVKVYDCFVQGVKEGAILCFRIFPYLFAMIVAVTVFRVSGGLDILLGLLSPFFNLIGLPRELIPLVLVKPLSGSGALGIYMEILKNYGVDTYIGRLSSIIIGSTETIFYTITIYFGAIGIKKIRHTLWAAIMGDIAAIIMAIFLVKAMF